LRGYAPNSPVLDATTIRREPSRRPSLEKQILDKRTGRKRRMTTMKARALTGFAATATGLAALAGAATAQPLDLKIGTTSPPGNMQFTSAAEFAKRATSYAAGKAKVEVFGSSQLGNDKEMLQKLKLATLDMSQPSTIMSTVLPEFGLFDMPYLVADRKHMACIAQKIIFPRLAPKLEPLGYKLIGVWENGFRQITNSKRAIVKPEDLKGIKLRTPRGTWRIKMFETYGASPSPMAFSEVFVALQTGVMDGQENPYSNIDAGKFQEVQKYLSETNHVYTPSLPTASLKRFTSWPKEVQDAIMKAAGETQAWTYQEAAKLDEATKKKLIAAGMQFNVADREAFVAASKPVYELFAKQVPDGKALIDEALALAKGC
jgi:tripartite ATP-independent transporter DctP family solute receptor